VEAPVSASEESAPAIDEPASVEPAESIEPVSAPVAVEPETVTQTEEPSQVEETPVSKEEAPIAEEAVKELEPENKQDEASEQPAAPEEVPSAPVQTEEHVAETPAPQEEKPEEAAKDSSLTPEILGAGAAAAAIGVAAVGVSSVLHKEPEAKHTDSTIPATHEAPSNDNADNEAPAAEQPTEDCKPTPFSTSHNVSVPSFEADPVLTALAGDREALLHKLNQPSTDQLTAAAAEHTATKNDKQTRVENEAEPTAESSPKAVDQLSPETAKTSNANEEDARPVSQNRSVTAVSLNSASDNWLKAFFRTVFVGFFGTIFSPFRRRGKSAK
jgi:hypothetical protein